MLKSQFYYRLFLIAVFGILFIFAMLKKGRRNSIENPPEKHITLKIGAGVILLLAIISISAGILGFRGLQFPSEMVKQPISPHSIVRSSSAMQYWGFPTSAQNMVLSQFSNAFSLLALASYLFVFRKSGTNWWGKTKKVFGIILLFVFYSSSTDLHFFDAFEMIAPIGFLTLAMIGLTIDNRITIKDKPVNKPTPKPNPLNEDDNRYMPNDESHMKEEETTVETIDVEL